MLHACWGVGRIPGSTVSQSDLVLVDSGLACDTFNLVCRARLRTTNAAERIRHALDHFQKAGRPFSWWVSPADRPDSLPRLLGDAGLGHAETSLGMSADLATLRDADLSPEGLAVHQVRDSGGLGEVARILAGWEQPDPVVLRFYELAAPALLARDSPRRFYLGHLAGEAVAVAEITIDQKVAGLYGVMTREPFRRRGFGMALTAAPLLEARAAGCHTGVLQASEAGAPVYRRLGFRPFGEIREFK